MTIIAANTEFPSFYAQCAYNDGICDARDGTDSSASFMRHGEPEPVGMSWYRKGLREGGAVK